MKPPPTTYLQPVTCSQASAPQRQEQQGYFQNLLRLLLLCVLVPSSLQQVSFTTQQVGEAAGAALSVIRAGQSPGPLFTPVVFTPSIISTPR